MQEVNDDIGHFIWDDAVLKEIRDLVDIIFRWVQVYVLSADTVRDGSFGWTPQQKTVQDRTDAVDIAMLCDFAGASCEEFIDIGWELVDFAIVQIGYFLKFAANFRLLGRDVLSIPRSHVEVNRRLLHIRQINLQDLRWIPIRVVQIQEAHLVKRAVSEEYFCGAQVCVYELSFVQNRRQIDHFQDEVYRSDLREDSQLGGAVFWLSLFF